LADDTPTEGEPAEVDAAAPEPEAVAPETVAPETVAAAEPEAAPEAVEAPATRLDENATQMLARLQAELGDAIIEHGATYGDAVVRVRPDAWRRTARFCKDELGCDYLSFISAIDWMPAPMIAEEGSGDTSTPAQPKEMTFGVAGSTGRFQVFAIVASTTGKHQRVVIKVDVDDDAPSIQSWNSVYPGADWHERETWEMFGIEFTDHPALRHLYLPFEFEGYPLRKDFPLLSRMVKPWPGLVDVEPMPGEPDEDETAETAEAAE
jgi:NADH-quinone oxidoreductase subunit C